MAGYAVIVVRRLGEGWQCCDGSVAAFFPDADARPHATDYALSRMHGRTGEIRVYDNDDNLERTFSFNEKSSLKNDDEED